LPASFPTWEGDYDKYGELLTAEWFGSTTAATAQKLVVVEYFGFNDADISKLYGYNLTLKRKIPILDYNTELINRIAAMAKKLAQRNGD
jgi:hypothetical protein